LGLLWRRWWDVRGGVAWGSESDSIQLGEGSIKARGPKCDPRPTRPRLHVFDFCTATRVLRVNICTSFTSAPQHASSSLTLEI
jgi:hypothetical protein